VAVAKALDPLDPLRHHQHHPAPPAPLMHCSIMGTFDPPSEPSLVGRRSTCKLGGFNLYNKCGEKTKTYISWVIRIGIGSGIGAGNATGSGTGSGESIERVRVF